jgi:hypothetical protein
MLPFSFRHDLHRRDLLRLAGASLIAAASSAGHAPPTADRPTPGWFRCD